MSCVDLQHYAYVNVCFQCVFSSNMTFLLWVLFVKGSKGSREEKEMENRLTTEYPAYVLLAAIHNRQTHIEVDTSMHLCKL